jgi:hypothetical protein
MSLKLIELRQARLYHLPGGNAALYWMLAMVFPESELRKEVRTKVIAARPVFLNHSHNDT